MKVNIPTIRVPLQIIQNNNLNSYGDLSTHQNII
jgi:hypothetical protein